MVEQRGTSADQDTSPTHQRTNDSNWILLLPLIIINIIINLIMIVIRAADIFNPLTPNFAIWAGSATKHPVPKRVKPSFVIFDIWAL